MTVAIRSAICARAKEVGVGAVPTLAVQDDPNRDFTPPVGGLWLQVMFQEGSEQQLPGQVKQLVRRPILAYLTVFGPKGTGDGAVVGLADKLREGIRRFNGDGFQFVKIQEGPEGVSNDWYRKQIIGVFRQSFRV